ncbi:hypothetical protein AVEN_261862-1 [Araneus ventricosus]|uniref:SWIM-type domain-containing protein n=1 Tax=Araneus ventricosus TaxID=182803 RepID=A0A4Y2Q6B3_ARAVE|nr:hypothetical protein AVEN_261862-1 [Araneus ventricosus]
MKLTTNFPIKRKANINTVNYSVSPLQWNHKSDHFPFRLQLAVVGDELTKLLGEYLFGMVIATFYRYTIAVIGFTSTMCCTCAVGAVPAYCKHVFTLLNAISDYSKQKLYAAPTAKLQTWHQPKAVKTVPLPPQEVFGKPSTYCYKAIKSLP